MKLVVLALLCLTLPARAGDTAGNGGDVVSCQRDQRATFRVLDYFEGELVSPPVLPSLGIPAWDALARVRFALERLRGLDPDRYARYERLASRFYDDVERWIDDGPPLEDIDDSGEVKLPASCKLVQAAIRRKQFHPSVKPYLIDRRIWKQMDETDRAGLMLHEIIYGEMYQLGHRDSAKARRYTLLLSSPAFEGMGAEAYRKLTADLFKIVHPPKFKADTITLNALAGQKLDTPLRSFLQHEVERPLTWTTLEPLPPWLVIHDERLVGIPPGEIKGKVYELHLVVRDGTTGAISRVLLTVK